MFTLSKIVGVLIDPSWWLTGGLLLGALLWLAGRARAARWPFGLALLIAAVAGLTPVGSHLAAVLEERFPAAPAPAQVDGIVMLGGLVNPELSAARGTPALNGAAERLTVFVELARRYPDAKLVFSGGSGSLRRPELKEAPLVRRLVASLGLDPARILFDDQSRNTHENALESLRLARPGAGETWLLVTSALHMPRAVGCFRAAGFPVTAYPVDHRTLPGGHHWLPGLAAGLAGIKAATHELMGLLAYRLLGRTNSLFPAP